MPSHEPMVEKLVGRLSSGLLDANYSIAFQAYNTLFRMGPIVIPHIEKEVLHNDWTRPRYSEASRYVAGMVALVRDIDEDQGTHLITKIVGNGCHDAIRGVLSSLSRFSLKNFDRYTIGSINVLEEKDVAAGVPVRRLLTTWLAHVPDDDKRDVVRILVVKQKDLHDAQGTYTPYLAKIVLGWPTDWPRGSVMSALVRFLMEKVLYHEFGHHVHKHTFGKIKEQEDEANRYAHALMRRSHPRVALLARLIPRCLTRRCS